MPMLRQVGCRGPQAPPTSNLILGRSHNRGRPSFWPRCWCSLRPGGTTREGSAPWFLAQKQSVHQATVLRRYESPVAARQHHPRDGARMTPSPDDLITIILVGTARGRRHSHHHA